MSKNRVTFLSCYLTNTSIPNNYFHHPGLSSGHVDLMFKMKIEDILLLSCVIHSNIILLSLSVFVIDVKARQEVITQSYTDDAYNSLAYCHLHTATCSHYRSVTS